MFSTRQPSPPPLGIEWPLAVCMMCLSATQNADEIQIIWHEPTCDFIPHPNELPHLLSLGSQAGHNRVNLRKHLPMTQVEAQTLYLHPSNCTLCHEANQFQRLLDYPHVVCHLNMQQQIHYGGITLDPSIFDI